MTHKPDNRELDGGEKAPMVGTGTYEYDGHAVDEFLWKGDPKATPVQRVGLVIYALMFLLLFVVFVVVVVMTVKHDFDWVSFLGVLMLGTLTGIAGFRLLFNVFRHQKHSKVDR